MDTSYDKKLLSCRFARLKKINRIKNEFKFSRAMKAFFQSEKKKTVKHIIWVRSGSYSVKKYMS